MFFEGGGGGGTPSTIRNAFIVFQYFKWIYHCSSGKAVGGRVLDFWNGGANVLIWGLQFGEEEIIWGLKF